jgi:broad specificity phosphatase PhoE
MSDVVLIRHAETEWSRRGRHTGRTDVPLTASGRAAASALGRRLEGRVLRGVFTSPLSRAAETARLAGLDGEPDADLMEWDYGEYEGLTTTQVRELRPEWSLWRDGCPGGEDAVAVGTRMDRVVARILEETEQGDGDVVLVAHGHVLRVLAVRWCGLDASVGGRLRLDTESVSVLSWERETRVIHRWNGR